MLKKRLIAVLIVRDGQVVQSDRFKHTNVIHYNAIHAIECFNKWAVDEIVILNVSSSPESREEFLGVVESISVECFVPLSVGGWVTDLDYATRLLASGADKLVVNTALADSPDFVMAMSNRFGRQCIVVSMDVMRIDDAHPVVMVDRGRRSVEVGPAEWARYAVNHGAGELLVNSIDHDGARKGYDLETIRTVSAEVEVPVIAFGGVFRWEHLVQGLEVGSDAVAAANIFHYTEHSTKKAKRFMRDAGIAVRKEL